MSPAARTKAAACGLFALAAGALMTAPRSADAFCGFYVSGSGDQLVNNATQVVLMRDGTKTVMSIQNDYKGPPADFAMIVPVPVVLQKENVKTLEREMFRRLETLSSPRLVEYWEQDPCPEGHGGGGIGLGNIGTLGHGAGTGVGQGFGAGNRSSVKVEAQFEVGEYEIVILSAKDSTGLDAWLRENKYKIPENAEAALKPYVASGSKFFVAKVNVAKVRWVDAKSGSVVATAGAEGARASLSPLRFHYDTDKLELPVKLGLLNSSGAQDLIVHILATDRYEVANYPNVTIPTNIDVADSARDSFGPFYATLFDRTLEKHPNAVVTEYAWTVSAQKCDPCPGSVVGITPSDIASLGADVLPKMASAAMSPATTSVVQVKALNTTKVTAGKMDGLIIDRIVRQNFGRFRLCYDNARRSKPASPALGGKVTIGFDINEKGEVARAKDAGSDLKDEAIIACDVRAVGNLTFPSPEDHKTVSVVYSFAYDPPAGSTNGGATGEPPASVTLTRLHARYSKDALGSDLIFKKAGPIVGGREEWIDGKLEHGSIKSPTQVSTFQARYAVRHPWQGLIDCKEPKRGIWGPNPGYVNRSTEPKAATDLAYADRGANVKLTSYTNATANELDTNIAMTPTPAPLTTASSDKLLVSPPDGGGGATPSDASTDDAGAGLAPRASRCGCRVIGAKAPSTSSGVVVGGAVLGLLALRRRRRRDD